MRLGLAVGFLPGNVVVLANAAFLRFDDPIVGFAAPRYRCSFAQ
jgi:hypothetical protein